MSFSITINGHAGSGMGANSQEEIDAVRNVEKAVREAFKVNNLNLGSYNVQPKEWLAPEETNG